MEIFGNPWQTNGLSVAYDYDELLTGSVISVGSPSELVDASVLENSLHVTVYFYISPVCLRLTGLNPPPGNSGLLTLGRTDLTYQPPYAQSRIFVKPQEEFSLVTGN